MDYPNNLIEAIFGIHPSAIEVKVNEHDVNIMNEIISALPDELQEVIKCRFIEKLTLHETASKIGGTRKIISEMEAKALRLLRHPKRSKLLKETILFKAWDRDHRIKLIKEETRNFVNSITKNICITSPYYKNTQQQWELLENFKSKVYEDVVKLTKKIEKDVDKLLKQNS